MSRDAWYFMQYNKAICFAIACISCTRYIRLINEYPIDFIYPITGTSAYAANKYPDLDCKKYHASRDTYSTSNINTTQDIMPKIK